MSYFFFKLELPYISKLTLYHPNDKPYPQHNSSNTGPYLEIVLVTPTPGKQAHENVLAAKFPHKNVYAVDP
jgi:hypothetical protein